MRTTDSEYELERIPPEPRLQAWEAADQYLLKHIDENQLAGSGGRILIFNDQFAALSIALANYYPVMVSDSHLSELALHRNLVLNRRLSKRVTFCNSLIIPQSIYKLILIKIPKSSALLEHQLHDIRARMNQHTSIIAAGMTRHIHNSTLELFEKILGPTRTTLAWKKSRLVLVKPNLELKPGQSPYPDEFILNVGQDLTISSHASLFSRNRLDAGTRLMIEHLPVSGNYQNIVDLGCGNGILGLVAALFNSEAALLFVDESYMAVDSAKQNCKAALAFHRSVEFRVSNCLEGVASDSMDLILNNPPFHQKNSVGDTTAWQMFIDGRRVLKIGGELWVVGNRHLAYHAKLKKIFGNCEQVTSNGKYVVLKTVKQTV